MSVAPYVSGIPYSGWVAYTQRHPVSLLIVWIAVPLTPERLLFPLSGA